VHAVCVEAAALAELVEQSRGPSRHSAGTPPEIHTPLEQVDLVLLEERQRRLEEVRLDHQGETDGNLRVHVETLAPVPHGLQRGRTALACAVARRQPDPP
jgi:hypothetical protein